MTHSTEGRLHLHQAPTHLSATPTPASPASDPIAIVRDTLNATLLGKSQVVERVLACMLSRGHVLIEDAPGLGKTTLAKTLAHCIGGKFTRVQCTPDLLPGDITGFNVFNQKTREFEFVPGPVFADVLLVDEINRATPRTQSALLEAMAEQQVTIDNVQHRLAESFFVIATQNPIEHHGTYPLPEAQLDRFAMKLSIGYPDAETEVRMLESAIGRCCDPPVAQPVVLSPHGVHELQEQVVTVHVSEPVRRYMVELCRATRNHPRIPLGMSPRGILVLQRLSQAWAYLHHRDFVSPADVREVLPPVLSVRLPLPVEQIDVVLQQLLETIPVPSIT
jgi:MoxR-like ATPase